MIETLFAQYWVASAVLAAANLGVADVVGSSPKDIEEIARAVGADTQCLFRLLRSLASVGVFREERPRHFVNTQLSAELRNDSRSHARAMIRMMGLKSIREAMPEFESAIRTGRPAFELVHGGTAFDVLARRPDEAAIYHEGMASSEESLEAIVNRYDFADVKRLVDVGGGRGKFLSLILQRNPSQQGVLLDLPEVVAGAVLHEYGVSPRCVVQAGDMRVEVPVEADGYILKNVMHGWPDPDCIALLQRIRAAAAEKARIFVIENVMPAGNGRAPCKLFDLFLLLGGSRSRVRSEREFRDIFDRSGCEFSRLIPIAGNQCIVEARCLPRNGLSAKQFVS